MDHSRAGGPKPGEGATESLLSKTVYNIESSLRTVTLPEVGETEIASSFSALKMFFLGFFNRTREAAPLNLVSKLIGRFSLWVILILIVTHIFLKSGIWIPSYRSGIICFMLAAVDSATQHRLSHAAVTVSPSLLKMGSLK